MTADEVFALSKRAMSTLSYGVIVGHYCWCLFATVPAVDLFDALIAADEQGRRGTAQLIREELKRRQGDPAWGLMMAGPMS